MTVIRTKVSGFCMGVRRAVDMALEAAAACNNVYTLGPLVHNKNVLDELKKKGIKVLFKDDMPPSGSKVIIRAHGIAPQMEEKLNAMGVNIIDATCPKVKASQKKVKEFAEKGHVIFLAGEKDHGEIIGLKGFATSSDSCDTSCYVIADIYEAEKTGQDVYKRNSGAKPVLVGQTTLSQEEYDAIGKTLKKYFPCLETVNTICNATVERQDALRELSDTVDAVIIAGGRDSANTGRLLTLAHNLGKPAWLAESAEKLPLEIKSYDKIGLAAGASAPDSLVDEIEQALCSID